MNEPEPVGAIEVVKRLRDECFANYEHYAISGAPTASAAYKLEAYDEIIEELESLAPSAEAVERLRDAWNDEYEHYAVSGAPTALATERLAAVHKFADQLIRSLPPATSAPSVPTCELCGHDYVATDPKIYDCRAKVFDDDPTPCCCDADFHSAPSVPTQSAVRAAAEETVELRHRQIEKEGWTPEHDDLIFALVVEHKKLVDKHNDDHPQSWHKLAVFLAIAALVEDEYRLKDWREMLPVNSRKRRAV